MNLLVDNQLPPALARFVENEFRCSAIHVVDVGLRDASDAEVWLGLSNGFDSGIERRAFRKHGSPRAHGQANVGQNWQLPQGGIDGDLHDSERAA